jgi:hypothetical protein
MHRLEREVVKTLKTKIFQADPKPWYEIFLTYFVMLTHLQFIHSQAVGFMKIREQTVSVHPGLLTGVLDRTNFTGFFWHSQPIDQGNGREMGLLCEKHARTLQFDSPRFSAIFCGTQRS